MLQTTPEAFCAAGQKGASVELPMRVLKNFHAFHSRKGAPLWLRSAFIGCIRENRICPINTPWNRWVLIMANDLWQNCIKFWDYTVERPISRTLEITALKVGQGGVPLLQCTRSFLAMFERWLCLFYTLYKHDAYMIGKLRLCSFRCCISWQCSVICLNICKTFQEQKRLCSHYLRTSAVLKQSRASRQK